MSSSDTSSVLMTPAPVAPEPTYFSLRNSRGYPASPGSRATTPGTPADERAQLLSNGTRPSFFRIPVRPKDAKFPKTSGIKPPTKLQAKWLNRSQGRFSTEPSVEPSISSNVVNTTGDHRPIPLKLTRSAKTSNSSIFPRSISSTALDNVRATEPSSAEAKDFNSNNSDSSAASSPVAASADESSGEPKHIGDADDDEALRIRELAIPAVAEDEPRGRLPRVSSAARPALSRQNSSQKWADRLRQRSLSRSPSTQSLSALLSPQLPSLPTPSLKPPRSPLATHSTPNLEDTLKSGNDSTTSLRGRRSGKHLDVAIDFDRIRPPTPLSRSASLADLRDPFASSDAVDDAARARARIDSNRPYRGVPQLSRQNSSDSTDSYLSFSGDEDDDEDDELGPPPEVPPALEYVDPEIECVAPSASTATLPRAEAQLVDQQHPWTEPPFNIVERPEPKIHKFLATFKVSVSLGVVISLLVGYGLRVKIVKVGPWSFGMYGLLLVIDFFVQTIAASFNRRRVNKLTKKSPIVEGVAERLAAKEATGELPTTTPAPLPECSIAVVGYREDEEAWMACLKSLQAQEFPIKHIIGVVDGNDGPDMAMANAFGTAFPEGQALISHLPVLLSVMYKEKYWEHINSLGHPPLSRWQYFKMWLSQDPRPGQAEAHEVAWNHTLNYLHAKAQEERWADWKGICFSQPHGHKRHAMFTAFMVGAYALGTKDAMLTTDSDTYVYPDAVKNMMALLFSDCRLAGVTGDVRIWNKSDSFLALMSSIRYWFAFNVERACQSAFGCVGCLSGPLGLYKTSDLISVLGPWILQSFLGKETTFGDDRHLSNRILSLGHKTGYTHLAMCDSDTPAGYVRWVKQQTRWSKSFFREAFWFPKSFAYHRFWLTVETTKQFLYPMVLTATVLQMLYRPSSWIRPVIWLATMFGVALIKSIYGVVCLRDPRQFLFGIYGFMYFFGLLPSKLFACFTVHITNWGTSARSKSEFARPESFLSRTTHVGHLVVWYLMLSVGLSYLLVTVFHQPFFWLVSILGVALSGQAYSDVIIGESKYAMYMIKKKWKARRAAKAGIEDVEKVAGKTKQRRGLKFRRNKKRADKEKAALSAEIPPVAEIEEIVAPSASVDVPSTDDIDAHAGPSVLPSVMPAVENSFEETQDVASQSHPVITISSPSVTEVPLAISPAAEMDRKPSLASTTTTESDESFVRTPGGDRLAEEPALGYFPASFAVPTVDTKYNELDRNVVKRVEMVDNVPFTTSTFVA